MVDCLNHNTALLRLCIFEGNTFFLHSECFRRWAEVGSCSYSCRAPLVEQCCGRWAGVWLTSSQQDLETYQTGCTSLSFGDSSHSQTSTEKSLSQWTRLHSFVQRTVSEHLSHWCKMGRQWEGWEQSNEKGRVILYWNKCQFSLLFLMSETVTRCFCFFPLLSSDVSL